MCAAQVNHLGEHDFWPEEYVLERGEDAYVAGEGQLASDALRRVGLVRQVSSADRTALVQWLPRDAQARHQNRGVSFFVTRHYSGWSSAGPRLWFFVVEPSCIPSAESIIEG